jgi:hypothetical protein
VCTSSDRLGRGASSTFFSIFCLRLSLLAGRVGFDSSSSGAADRLEADAVPRAVRELGVIDGCREGLAACDEVIDDDEFLGRAVAGGVCDERRSMAANLL